MHSKISLPGEDLLKGHPAISPSSIFIPNSQPPDEKVAPRKISGSVRLLWFLAVLGGFYTLYFARAFFIPLTMAAFLAVSLMPLIRSGERIGIRAEFSALLTLSVFAGVLALGVVSLSDPLKEWLTAVPASASALESKIRGLVKPMSSMTETAARIDNVTVGNVTTSSQIVTLRPPRIVDRLFAVGRDVVFSIGLVLLFLYFFLSYGERLTATARAVFPVSQDGTDARDVVDNIAASMSQYFLVIGLINCCLGLVEWGAMALVGMPNAALWGVMAGTLNFIPYLGGFLGVSTISIVSLLTFNGLGNVVLPPLIYFTIDSVEGVVITPLIVGHRFSINPALGVVWLVLWGWLWGPIGGFMAMPMLMALKILSDHVPALAGVGALLELDRGKCREKISPLVVES